MSLLLFFVIFVIFVGLLISECTWNVDIPYCLWLAFFYWNKPHIWHTQFKVLQRRWSHVLSSGDQRQDQRQWAQSGTWNIILNIRKHFFIVMVSEHENTVPKGDVHPPSCPLAACPRWSCLSRGVEFQVPEFPPNPEHSMILQTQTQWK